MTIDRTPLERDRSLPVKPRRWITPAARPQRPGVGYARSRLERRVLASRREAQAWVTAGSNAERVGAHLASRCDSTGRRGPSRGRTLADYAALLEEYGVPGVAPPPDLSTPMALRWSRSVTLVVLRHLRQHGHLHVAFTAPVAPRQRPPEGIRWAQHVGVSPHAGASPAPTKVASMAELPHPSPAPRPGPTQFPPLRLQVDRRSLHVQRLDAQAAVDVARQQSILARHALLSGPAGADATPARIAADDASTLLQAAVDLLTALNGGDSTVGVTLDIDVTSDDATTVVRPHGELDLFTSSTLEQRCLAHLDSGTVDRLVVDLSAVTFLDSSAMAVLVEIHRVCLLKATPFAIIRPTARTRRLLSITRLDTVLDVG